MMPSFLLKSFVFATTSATLINVFYVNLIKKNEKILFPQTDVKNETIFDSLKSNNPTKISELLENKTPTLENTLNTIKQQKDLNSKESEKEEIKEKLRTEIQTSIFSLQKNLLNLIIQKQTVKQEIIDKKINFNTNKILDNENNQLKKKEEEILESLKNDIKKLYETKKNLRKKNSEYLNNVYNFFFLFSFSQELQRFFWVAEKQGSKESEFFRPIDLIKKTFPSENETENIFGILFKNITKTNPKTLLDIGSENSLAKEWNDFSQLKINDSEINDFDFTKEEFKLLNSHWETPLCEISDRKKPIISLNSEDKIFFYSCSEENEINIKKNLDILIENYNDNTSNPKFQKLKEKINNSWDDLKKEKNKFADEVKKIQTVHLTYKLTQKEILEFLSFENIQENKNIENLIKKLSEKWRKESFLKVIVF